MNFLKGLKIVLFKISNYRHFQSFDYSHTSAGGLPNPTSPAGLYPPLPQGYDSSYIGSAPPAYSGQFLSPNTSAYPPAVTGTNDFEDEPPLLEGM